jgi:hypothetical protein
MRAAAAVLGLSLVIVCAGCGFSSTLKPANDADPPGETDADLPDGTPGDGACASFSQRLDTCALALSGDIVVLGTGTYNTDLHELRVGGQPVAITRTTFHTIPSPGDAGNDVEAILAHDVTIRAGAILRAFGNQSAGAPPFAIIASGTVTLEDGAAIDVSDGGAGALPVCSTAPDPGVASDRGAGGGGGGSYGAAGGRGGNGDAGPMQVPGGKGGDSVAMPSGLRGGCPGAPGGDGTGNTVGAEGRGGGAIFIAAGVEIKLGTNAVLYAGGGGGGGGGHGTGPDTGNAGGGGGGSGGMIALESPRVTAANARMAANGGGGGEGSSLLQAGNNGATGTTTTAAAPGGTGGAQDGADGGQGGDRASAAGQSVATVLAGGGGGGGGGVGYIHIVSLIRQLSGNISPAPVVSP